MICNLLCAPLTRTCFVFAFPEAEKGRDLFDLVGDELEKGVDGMKELDAPDACQVEDGLRKKFTSVEVCVVWDEKSTPVKSFHFVANVFGS